MRLTRPLQRCSLRIALAVCLVVSGAGCTNSRHPGSPVTTPTARAAENPEPSIEPDGGSCSERGLTAFCDDVFTGPNRVTVQVRPTAARPGQRVRVSGVSDCGVGVLDVDFTTPAGKSIPVRLTWASAPHGLQAFTGVFVVPRMQPGVIDVGALAFCRDASYEHSTSTRLRVLGKR